MSVYVVVIEGSISAIYLYKEGAERYVRQWKRLGTRQHIEIQEWSVRNG